MILKRGVIVLKQNSHAGETSLARRDIEQSESQGCPGRSLQGYHSSALVPSCVSTKLSMLIISRNLAERRLAQHAQTLKQRNKLLLHASTSGSSSSSDTVKQAYITSLEQQISSLREEVSTSYRTSSQNVSRLLSLTDALREQEDLLRTSKEETRTLRTSLDAAITKQADHKHLIQEKEKIVLNLNDELQAVQLELTQLEKKNEGLRTDNRNLLQRWLDRVNSEVEQVNEANAFIVSCASLLGADDLMIRSEKESTARLKLDKDDTELVGAA